MRCIFHCGSAIFWKHTHKKRFYAISDIVNAYFMFCDFFLSIVTFSQVYMQIKQGFYRMSVIFLFKLYQKKCYYLYCTPIDPYVIPSLTWLEFFCGAQKNAWAAFFFPTEWKWDCQMPKTNTNKLNNSKDMYMGQMKPIESFVFKGVV